MLWVKGCEENDCWSDVSCYQIDIELGLLLTGAHYMPKQTGCKKRAGINSILGFLNALLDKSEQMV